MSYDESVKIKRVNPIREWMVDWISDWFGLFDIVIGIITLTWYYPQTQQWWFSKWSR